jgi:CubicO group peptidase (beta-lactamase class C family)
VGETVLDIVLEAAGGWGADTVSVAVSDRDGVRASYGDTHRAVAIASVTKLVSSWAILVAVEEGTIALDEPAGPNGATVAHLLAHASGLAPDSSEILAPPATKRIYSNAGFDELGALLAERAAIDAPSYVLEAVIEPLGMAATFSGSSLAHGISCSAEALATFGREVLSPTLISASLAERALSPQWPDLDGVLPGFGRQTPNPWGLGFEVRGVKSPHWMGTRVNSSSVGHFGRGGSFLIVDPTVQLVVAVATDRQFDTWAVEAWPPFVDAIVGSWV